MIAFRWPLLLLLLSSFVSIMVLVMIIIIKSTSTELVLKDRECHAHFGATDINKRKRRSEVN